MTETAFDPVRTSCRITASYRRYLASLLSARDHRIGAALQREITETTLLDKGPFLEATPPYRPGATLGELISEGVLCGEFEHLGGPALPLERPLYIHQEAAIRKVNSGRNVVVATGTGSGKTESFLLPILDSLARERTTGTLGPGVRALLLYPMNALANDQMKRMRSLLATCPHLQQPRMWSLGPPPGATPAQGWSGTGGMPRMRRTRGRHRAGVRDRR